MNLLTLAQVAEQLAVSEKTVERLVKRGELAVIRIGRQVRVRPADLDAFMAAARQQTTTERLEATLRVLPQRRALRPGYWGR